MGVYVEGLDMPKEHSLWMVIHPNGQVWMRKRHYCQNLEGAEATEFDLVKCGECKWWTKQADSIQGRCELLKMYPTSAWYCGNGERRADEK